MTPQKKRLYIAILACGVIALIIDRMAVGYTPKVAFATTATSTNLANDSTEVAAIESIPELPFPHLVKVLGPGEFVDFFMPPTLRHRLSTPTENNGTSDINNAAKKTYGKTDYLTFESTYTLDAVMLSPKFHVAIINGSWVQLGQSLDGCKLSELTDNIARFECSDGTATLSVISVTTLLQD